MLKRKLQIAFILLLGCCGTSCRREASTLAQSDSATPSATISGQVFIVTRGAENLRLGQLTVGLVAKQTFDDLHITDRAAAEARILQTEFSAALARGHQTEQLVSEVKRNYAELLEDRKALGAIARAGKDVPRKLLCSSGGNLAP